jgi:hypothetical protein
MIAANKYELIAGDKINSTVSQKKINNDLVNFSFIKQDTTVIRQIEKYALLSGD